MTTLLDELKELRAVGTIAPNSGTGELRGLSGTVEFKSEENGKSIILDFALPDEDGK